jgi:hypothetical protein
MPKDEFTTYGVGAFYTKSTGEKTSIARSINDLFKLFMQN